MTVYRFRVKDKGSIKDLKSSSKMLIFANNCQFGSRFCFRPDEADAFLVNTHLNPDKLEIRNSMHEMRNKSEFLILRDL